MVVAVMAAGGHPANEDYPPKTMSRITSDFDEMCFIRIKWPESPRIAMTTRR